MQYPAVKEIFWKIKKQKQNIFEPFLKCILKKYFKNKDKKVYIKCDCSFLLNYPCFHIRPYEEETPETQRDVEGSICYLSSRHLHLSTGVTQCFIEQEGMISPKDFTLLFWNYSIKKSNRQWEKTILKIRYSELFFFSFSIPYTISEHLEGMWTLKN